MGSLKDMLPSAIGMGVGALIGGPPGAMIGGSLGSAFTGSQASGKLGEASQAATQAQMNALMQGQGIQREMWEKQLELGAPYRQLGYGVLPQLNQLATGDISQSPEYQWRLGQGEETINRAMAARGLQFSRPAINALADYTGGLTSEMSANQFNRLLQLADLGQGATAQAIGGAGQYGANMANLYEQMGQTQAGGIMNQGNIMANMYGNLGAMPMNMLNTYMLGKGAGLWPQGGGSQTLPTTIRGGQGGGYGF
jgi:hypothetical protein